MGAYRVALLTQEQYNANLDMTYKSTIFKTDELNQLNIKISHVRCKGCENKCLLTINTFKNGKKFISGNRCEKEAESQDSEKQNLPNIYKYKYERLFSYRPLSEADANRGTIGIPKVLNMYEDYPFWFTFLTKIGFRVIISEKSNRKTYEKWLENCKELSAKQFKQSVKDIIADFKKIDLDTSIEKPKVGIVGVVLIKYHPFGNNEVIKILEQEGAEVISPDFMGFIKFVCTHKTTNYALLKTDKKKSIQKSN